MATATMLLEVVICVVHRSFAKKENSPTATDEPRLGGTLDKISS